MKGKKVRGKNQASWPCQKFLLNDAVGDYLIFSQSTGSVSVFMVKTHFREEQHTYMVWWIKSTGYSVTFYYPSFIVQPQVCKAWDWTAVGEVNIWRNNDTINHVQQSGEGTFTSIWAVPVQCCFLPSHPIHITIASSSSSLGLERLVRGLVIIHVWIWLS